MKIEIVEFYENKFDKKKKTLIGSLHIYLIDIDWDLRGIYVKKEKNKWFFGLPNYKSKDKETNKLVTFPVIIPTNLDKKRELINDIRKQGIKYISEKYKF